MECVGQFDILHIDSYMDTPRKQIDRNIIEAKIFEIREGLIKYGIKEEIIDDLLKRRRMQFPYTKETLLKYIILFKLIFSKLLSKISIGFFTFSPSLSSFI